MTQATLNGDKYQNQSALKAAMTLESSMIQAGLLRPEGMEDAFLVCEAYTKRFVDLLIEGDTATLTQKGFNEGKLPTKKEEQRMATENQRKALYAISKNNPEAQLTKDTDQYTFHEASEFIELYGKK